MPPLPPPLPTPVYIYIKCQEEFLHELTPKIAQIPYKQSGTSGRENVFTHMAALGNGVGRCQKVCVCVGGGGGGGTDT